MADEFERPQILEYASGQPVALNDVVFPAEPGLRRVPHVVVSIDHPTERWMPFGMVGVVELASWHYRAERTDVAPVSLRLIRRGSGGQPEALNGN